MTPPKTRSNRNHESVSVTCFFEVCRTRSTDATSVYWDSNGQDTTLQAGAVVAAAVQDRSQHRAA